MALAAPRKIARLGEPLYRVDGVAAAAVCIQGGLAVLVAGYARPGRAGQGGTTALKSADVATYVAVGVFAESVTGGVADGDKVVNIQTGTFPFKNSSGADLITIADIGRQAFIIDDETVARTSSGETRAAAGIIDRIDSDGVWVRIEPASNGKRKVFLPFAINETDTLAGTSAELVSPVAGAITLMQVIVQKAVTTGGPVTAAVGVTAVAGLSCVIPDAAAKGSVVSDAPTLADATTLVSVGSRIQVVPDAAFATAGAVSGYVEISY